MVGSWTNSGAASDLLIPLDRAAPVALHRQIETAIREGVRSGRLPLGASVPPTRTLAADLGVSRGIVVEAYQQLVAEGYLSSRPGGYTTVAAGPSPAPPQAPVRVPPEVRIDFGYGRADVAHFPRAAWLRSLRRVLTQAPDDRFGYASGGGVPELRLALADYLNRVRGTNAAPSNVVVTSGFAQGIALVVQVLARRGARRIAVEDPSADDDAREHARAAGLEVVGVPVGPDGVDVAALAGVSANALVLTPSHQWPTGGVLPPPARAAVLRWAREHDAVVVEDDYDAEHRYDRAPVGALQGLGPDRVVYAGTASKTLAPGLRIGWLVPPAWLVDELAAAKVRADRGSSAVDQLALADFLAHGEFDRHLRRMRPVYRRRRDALLAGLARHLPGFRPAGVAAGLHLVAWLPPGLTEDEVVAAGRSAGVGVGGVGRYRLGPGPEGLIFGYATLDPPAIEEGLALLSGALH
ncbi:GntR family transcriptional regulator / MocR family aminotransferase [Asanoa hainanensis]|uniref:GntR family transcriptional regulator / MocR family aminotransferase n=1 Tax=Asanoa hainanensis TaxID=560556 RepID=A0A239IPK9_9ACTN|nr:PLP-dependent aminotransferase family protein [Asanoa hainanensis]SNS95501.1 GntR family transcriptional regulator / MocR family aminotransferase [Asanoa hainanensis]